MKEIEIKEGVFAINPDTSFHITNSFTIKKGKIITLYGLNGSGKSTFLNYLAKVYSRSQLKVGFLPQGYDQITQRWLTEKTIFKLFGQKQRSTTNKKIKLLSNGQRQNLALEAIATKDNDIVLLDEPFSALDAGKRKEKARFIRTIAKNKSVLIIEHDPPTVQYLSDTILAFNSKSRNIKPFKNNSKISEKKFNNSDIDPKQYSLINRYCDE